LLGARHKRRPRVTITFRREIVRLCAGEEISVYYVLLALLGIFSFSNANENERFIYPQAPKSDQVDVFSGRKSPIHIADWKTPIPKRRENGIDRFGFAEQSGFNSTKKTYEINHACFGHHSANLVASYIR